MQTIIKHEEQKIQLDGIHNEHKVKLCRGNVKTLVTDKFYYKFKKYKVQHSEKRKKKKKNPFNGLRQNKKGPYSPRKYQHSPQ